MTSPLTRGHDRAAVDRLRAVSYLRVSTAGQVYTEYTAIGDLVATVLDGVNEYQSRASGADIAYKMGRKIINGGSVGRARIGYLNVRDTSEGREIRTIAVDPVRAPLVRTAFELY